MASLDGVDDLRSNNGAKVPTADSSNKMLTGVVEVGLFCCMAKAAYFGNEV